MSRKTNVTLHDIATKLRLTTSTVSRALNNHPKISDITKKAVVKMADKLNYQPHTIAAALRKGKSGFLGIIVPAADSAFFASIVRGIEEVANKREYNVVVCQSYDHYEAEMQAIERLLRVRVDGIIASTVRNTSGLSHFRKVSEAGIPLLLLGRATEEPEVSQITSDDYLGAYRVTEHLIQQGCKRIGHFTSLQGSSVFKERLRGYRNALLDYGIPYGEELVVESNLQLHDGRKSMEKLLGMFPLPDGVFSSGDLAAMGAMQVLKERNIRIPGEVALAGFGNDPFTAFTDPPLTTADPFSKTMGTIAAELILEQLNSDSESPSVVRTRIIKPGLIIRASSLKERIRPINAAGEVTRLRSEAMPEKQTPLSVFLPGS